MLNFALPGQENALSNEQVIFGDMRVRGQFNVDIYLQDIRLAVSSALSKVCENRSVPVLVETSLEIAFLNDLKPEIIMQYHMLPPIGGGQYCMESLAMVSYGNVQPPFDDVIGPPPIRELIQMELKANTRTFTWRLDNWKIDMANHTCQYMLTMGPVERAITKWTTTKPPNEPDEPQEACRDGDPLMPAWVPPDQVPDAIDPRSCNYAVNPCLCAALGNCTWSSNQYGTKSCQPAQPWESVGCEHCALQKSCPLTAADICGLVISPCACAASAGDCRWDLEEQVCLYRNGTGPITKCGACTAQNFCSRPSALFVQPPYDPDQLPPLLGKQIGWVVNVTFDRWVTIGALVTEYGITLQCRSAYEEDYRIFPVSVDQVDIVENGSDWVAQVNVQSVPNERRRECDLVISEYVFRDRDFVYFPGINHGTLVVTLDDNTKPELVRYFPPNSQTGVDINRTITIYFNEVIFPEVNSTAEIVLFELGGNRLPGEAPTAADRLVGKIPIDGSGVIFDEETKSLTIDFRGLVVPGILYSFGVPEGCLVDKAGNSFAGLKTGLYAFRTTLLAIEADVADEDSVWEMYLLCGAAGLAGLITLTLVVILIWRHIKVKMKFRAMRRVQEEPPKPLKHFVPDPSRDVLDGLNKEERCKTIQGRKDRIRASRRVSISSNASITSPGSPVGGTGSRRLSQAWTADNDELQGSDVEHGASSPTGSWAGSPGGRSSGRGGGDGGADARLRSVSSASVASDLALQPATPTELSPAPSPTNAANSGRFNGGSEHSGSISPVGRLSTSPAAFGGGSRQSSPSAGRRSPVSPTNSASPVSPHRTSARGFHSAAAGGAGALALPPGSVPVGGRSTWSPTGGGGSPSALRGAGRGSPSQSPTRRGNGAALW